MCRVHKDYGERREYNIREVIIWLCVVIKLDSNKWWMIDCYHYNNNSGKIMKVKVGDI